MILLPPFSFSQASLQDYADCPRRFQLRYLLRVAWPALEAEPALESERHLQQGSAFHRLVHQHVVGIAPERLAGMLTDADLRRWWDNYLEHGLQGLPASRYPEIVLSAPVGDHRLVAKYDLIAVDAGQRAAIVDWKTSRRRPKRRHLAQRLQTRVYPYLLVQAGAHLNAGQPFCPEQVEMVYWFANFPAAPERFAYDAAQYEADEVYLASLIAEIEGLGEEGFPLTTDERRCEYCPYRSLCRRGVRAGALDEAEDDTVQEDLLHLDIDFEQIAEIEF
jgi:CRISPR/Cas system-associated exonuclease Cas4 (RecB family)